MRPNKIRIRYLSSRNDSINLTKTNYFQPCQCQPTTRQQEPKSQGTLGEMASCMDDGLGTRPSPKRKIELSPRIGEGQELRLGRLEKTFLETSQQQEIQGYGFVQEIGRGRRWLPHPG